MSESVERILVALRLIVIFVAFDLTVRRHVVMHCCFVWVSVSSLFQLKRAIFLRHVKLLSGPAWSRK